LIRLDYTEKVLSLSLSVVGGEGHDGVTTPILSRKLHRHLGFFKISR